MRISAFAVVGMALVCGCSPTFYITTYDSELVALKTTESIEGHAVFCIFGGSSDVDTKDVVRFMVKHKDGGIHMKRLNATMVTFHEINGRTPYVRFTVQMGSEPWRGEDWPERLIACDIYVPADAVVHDVRVGLD